MIASSDVILDGIYLSRLVYQDEFDDSYGAEGGAGLGWNLVNRSDLNFAGVPSAPFFNGDFLYDSFLGQAFIARRENEVALVFRGTQGASDLYVDSRLPLLIDEYYAQFAVWLTGAFKNYVESIPGARAYVFGHSLGGAMAEMFMSLNGGAQFQAVTFGSPGINSTNALLGITDDRITNIQHSGDPVPKLPLFTLNPSGQVLNINLPTLSFLDEHSSSTYYDTAVLLQNSEYYNTISDQEIVVAERSENSRINLTNSENGLFVLGGNFDDVLRGGIADDIIEGGIGNDILEGGFGSDIIDGGSGNNDIVEFGRTRDSYTLFNRSNDGFELLDNITGETDFVRLVEWISFSGSGLQRVSEYYDWWDSVNSPPDPVPNPEPEPGIDPTTDGGSEPLLSVQAVNRTIEAGSSIALSELFPESGWVDNDGLNDIVSFAVADRSIGGGFLTVNGVRVQDGQLRDNIPIHELSNWRFVAGPDASTDNIGFNIIQANGEFSPRLDPGAIVTTVVPDVPIVDPNPSPDPAPTSNGSNIAVLSFSSSASGASPSGSVEVIYTITNLGDERSARGEADIILANTADLQSGRRIGDSFNIPELNPGESRTYTRTTELPNSANGNFFLGVDVRSNSLGHNQIEDDDTGSIPFQIAPGLSGNPDLRTNLSTPEDILAQGTSNDVNISVLTNSNGSPIYDYQIVLSRDEFVSADDIVLLNETSSRGLGSLGTGNFVESITIPDFVEDGLYHLISTADPFSRIAETNEENNNAINQVIVSGRPADGNDLFNFVGSHVTVSSDVMEVRTSYNFQAFGFMDSVDDAIPLSQNGSPTTVGLKIFISDDNIFDASDIAIRDSIELVNEPTGQILDVSVTFQIPQWINSGDYYVFGVFDPEDEYEEDFEFDNITDPTAVTIINNQVRTVTAGDDTLELAEGSSQTLNILDNDTTSISQDLIVLRFEGDQVSDGSPFVGLTDSGLTYQISRDGTLLLDTSTLTRDILPGEKITETFRYESRGLGTGGSSDLGEVTITIRELLDPELSIISGDFSGNISEDDESISGAISIQGFNGQAATFANIVVSGKYGEVTVNEAGDQWNYTPGLLAQYLTAGVEVEDVITLTASNGATQELRITVIGQDDPVAFIGESTLELFGTENGVSGALSPIDLDTPGINTFVVNQQSGNYGIFDVSEAGNWTYQLTTSGINSLTQLAVFNEEFLIQTNRGVTTQISISNAIVRGSWENDNLQGSLRADVIHGNEGDDLITGGIGADVIDGGFGNFDTANYGQSSEGVTVNLTLGAGIGGEAQGDVLTGIEQVIGSLFDDIIAGNDANNVFFGFSGDDQLFGGAGSDFLLGGAGADHLDGGAGILDTSDYRSSAAGVAVDLLNGIGIGGDAEGDTLVSIDQTLGSAFNDNLIGNDADNILFGFSGDDTLSGGLGNDFLVSGLGADTLNGGQGNDTANYLSSADGVAVDLLNNVAIGGEAEGDTLISIENVIGTNSADTLLGSADDNLLFGFGGNDTFSFTTGIDTINGGTDIDTVIFSVNQADVNFVDRSDLGAGVVFVDDGAGNLAALFDIEQVQFNDTGLQNLSDLVM